MTVPGPTASGPLAGVTVVDLTRVLAGPYCTMVLADLGARVIKVEVPGTGDDSRRYGPFIDGKSAYFASLNRGKESIALDLKREDGRATFEPVIGYMKAEGHLGRNHLKERAGDTANAILSAVGYNLRLVLAWLRALLRLIATMLLVAITSQRVLSSAS